MMLGVNTIHNIIFRRLGMRVGNEVTPSALGSEGERGVGKEATPSFSRAGGRGRGRGRGKGRGYGKYH